uniref:Uncharacterized protein n=1 Tax=Callithrix jacchus TaxID=9483 RepID=A0A8I3W329_CALJA|nr:putative UPF0607 protein ENSP00000382826 [Callithrix jacchus]
MRTFRLAGFTPQLLCMCLPREPYKVPDSSCSLREVLGLIFHRAPISPGTRAPYCGTCLLLPGARPQGRNPVLRHFAREGPVKIPPPSLTFPLRLPPLQVPAPILKTAVRAEDGEEPMEVDNPVGILKTAVRAEEGEEPMEVDDQGLGVPSAPTPAGGVLPFGKPDPAPAALPGPVPGCSHWPDKAASLVLGKDHQPSSSAEPMEWEATQHKDPPAVATKGPSKPRAASRSSRQPKWLVQPQQLRLVPPQQWRWGRNEGPPPVKRPSRSVKGFMDTGKSSRTTSSRRLKKKYGKKLQ